MKVAMLNDWLHGGGAERSMVYIANEYVRINNTETTIYCLESGCSYALSPKITHTPFRKEFKSKLHKLFSLVPDAFRLKKEVENESLEIVLSFQIRSNIVNVLSKIFGSQHKVIISERVYANDFYNNVWYKFIAFAILKLVYNNSDLITCNANDIRIGLREIGVTKPIKVITNGYPKDEIVKLSNIIEDNNLDNFEDGKLSLISIGRLSDQKGHKYLLEALALLPENKLNNIRVLIIGEGPLKDEVYSLIDNLNLKEVVKIIPFTDSPYYYLKKADLLIMPSLYEGYPNVVCESIIVGTPVLAFDFKSGARELVTNDNGVLVDMFDVKALANEIERFSPNDFKPDSSKINDIYELGKMYQELFIDV